MLSLASERTSYRPRLLLHADRAALIPALSISLGVALARAKCRAIRGSQRAIGPRLADEAVQILQRARLDRSLPLVDELVRDLLHAVLRLTHQREGDRVRL